MSRAAIQVFVKSVLVFIVLATCCLSVSNANAAWTYYGSPGTAGETQLGNSFDFFRSGGTVSKSGTYAVVDGSSVFSRAGWIFRDYGIEKQYINSLKVTVYGNDETLYNCDLQLYDFVNLKFVNTGKKIIDWVEQSYTYTDAVKIGNFLCPQNNYQLSDHVMSSTIDEGNILVAALCEKGEKATVGWIEVELGITDAQDPYNVSIRLGNGNNYTNSPQIPVELSASDSVGITGYYLSANTTAPKLTSNGWINVPIATSYNATVNSPHDGIEGVKNRYVWYKDAGGRISSISSDSIIFDNTPPSSATADFTAVQNGSNVLLNWSGFTDANGIASYKIVYSTSGIPATCSSGTVLYDSTDITKTTFTHTGPANNTRYYYHICATDVAGNRNAGLAASVLVDTAKPSGTVSIAGGEVYVNSRAIGLSLTATDNRGVVGYYILETTSSTPPAAPSIDATGWTAITSTTSYSNSVGFDLATPGNGRKYIYVWYKDAIGNKSGAAATSIVFDNVRPNITAFDIPATSSSLTVPITSFSATDLNGIAGYKVTISSTKPSASDAGWTATAPTKYTFGVSGTKTLYAWAKDNADNVSASMSGTVTITLPDTEAPVVTAFDLPATSSSLTVSINTLSASDNSGSIAGYKVTTSSIQPNASDAGWTTTAPTQHTFGASGTKTLYAWAKDASGNVSTALVSDTVTITLPDTTSPVVTAFDLPATSSSLTVPVTTFTATDNSGSVAGYMLTESATQPPATDAGWLAAAPADHTFASAGTKTLYAWAKDAAGNVSNSLSDTVTITIATIPIAPTGLTARSISSGTINLAWIDTSTNETGFEVWRKAGANAFALLATTAADAKSYSDATAASNTTTTGYVYYIKACNAEGCSQTKNAVVPFSPATLKATATGSAANLTWADKSANETAFLLERNVGACGAVTGTWTQIKSLSANTISYSDATVTGGTTYAYRIRAKAKSALTPYAVGYSFYSNCASVAVPNTTGGSIQLPETGQTTCYNEAGAEIACAGTGQDGELQMGVAWLNPRFVSGTGAEADCMIDTLTGLMWPKNGNLAGAVTWQGALDYVRNSINTVNLCGYSDWRIPSVIELESLVNAQQANSAEWLNGQRFSNVQSNYYWSSTTYSRNTSSAWVVGIVMGDMVYGSKADIYYAWPVRGGTGGALADIWVSGQKICYNTSGSVSACTGTGQDGDLQPGTAWPTPRFADNGDGTVTDKLTGLVWLKNANCYDRTMSWNEALFSVNSLSNGQCGLSDGSTAGTWRVPNRKELLSLMNFAYYSPSLSNLVGTGKWSQGDPFDNVVLSRYWSSSTNANITNDAWEADMIDGVLNYGWFKTHGYYVWPVRSGQ